MWKALHCFSVGCELISVDQLRPTKKFRSFTSKENLKILRTKFLISRKWIFQIFLHFCIKKINKINQFLSIFHRRLHILRNRDAFITFSKITFHRFQGLSHAYPLWMFIIYKLVLSSSIDAERNRREDEKQVMCPWVSSMKTNVNHTDQSKQTIIVWICAVLKGKVFCHHALLPMIPFLHSWE